jgi:molybdopterin/thiamine biosynthesis adenylyltransferase
MSKEKFDSIAKKTDALVNRMDSFATKRRIRKDEARKRMADARIAGGQKKLDAQKTVDDEDEYDDSDDDEDDEKDCMPDTQLDPGSLSKRNFETQ